jgi:hypothetical protein
MYNEVPVTVSPTGVPEQEKPVKYNVHPTQFVLVNPANGHVHATGNFQTVTAVWGIENKELGNELKLEVRELYIKEIRTVTVDELEYEYELQRRRKGN